MVTDRMRETRRAIEQVEMTRAELRVKIEQTLKKPIHETRESLESSLGGGDPQVDPSLREAASELLVLVRRLERAVEELRL
jgi:hypothetical protein